MPANKEIIDKSSTDKNKNRQPKPGYDGQKLTSYNRWSRHFDYELQAIKRVAGTWDYGAWISNDAFNALMAQNSDLPPYNQATMRYVARHYCKRQSKADQKEMMQCKELSMRKEIKTTNLT